MMSTETSDNVSGAELRESEPRSSGQREDNIRDDPQQQIPVPLGVELTGYRLLTTGVILGLGIPKAIYSYKGKALISTTLDWVAGITSALILYWLGVIEAQRPELSPRFFQADLAPPILKFLRRPEVHLWHFSVIPLLTSTTQLWAMLDGRLGDELAGGISAHQTKTGLIRAALAFSTAIIIFCLQCLWVSRPERFEAHHSLVFFICSAMWLTYYGYFAVAPTNQDYPLSILNMFVHYVLSIFPIFRALFRPLPGHREGLPLLLRYYDILMPAYVVLVEVVSIWYGLWGMPKF